MVIILQETQQLSTHLNVGDVCFMLVAQSNNGGKHRCGRTSAVGKRGLLLSLFLSFHYLSFGFSTHFTAEICYAEVQGCSSALGSWVLKIQLGRVTWRSLVHPCPHTRAMLRWTCPGEFHLSWVRSHHLKLLSQNVTTLWWKYFSVHLTGISCVTTCAGCFIFSLCASGKGLVPSSLHSWFHRQIREVPRAALKRSHLLCKALGQGIKVPLWEQELSSDFQHSIFINQTNAKSDLLQKIHYCEHVSSVGL